MHGETLDYRAPRVVPRRGRGPGLVVGIAALGLIVFIVNLLLAVWVATDAPGGWADFVTVVAAGPIANAIVAIVSLLLAPWMKRLLGGRTFVLYTIASVALPACGYFALYALITGRHLQ
jgi:hypothetical protein